MSQTWKKNGLSFLDCKTGREGLAELLATLGDNWHKKRYDYFLEIQHLNNFWSPGYADLGTDKIYVVQWWRV